jgi:hypothetical protein
MENELDLYKDLIIVKTEENTDENADFNSDFRNIYQVFKRQSKSLSQRIILLDVKYEAIENIIICKILGSSNKEYKLTFYINDNNNKEIKVGCTCMDFRMRKCICKHLYWFGKTNLKSIRPHNWNIYDIYEFLYFYLYLNKGVKGRNENCPICFEEIDYENEKVICCEYSCNNAVHNICWSRYKYANLDARCVCCRSYIFD